jgi:transcriptional regulator with XRE-family HTH domain
VKGPHRNGATYVMIKSPVRPFRVGLHRTYVSSVEREERNVTIQAADRIAKALGTTLSSMFSELERGPDGP